MTFETETAGERWAKSPRPLQFVRIRLYRGGQVELIREILESEKDTLFEDLTEMRTKGLAEDHPDIEKCRMDLRHIINVLKDVDQGMVELVGPDPR